MMKSSKTTTSTPIVSIDVYINKSTCSLFIVTPESYDSLEPVDDDDDDVVGVIIIIIISPLLRSEDRISQVFEMSNFSFLSFFLFIILNLLVRRVRLCVCSIRREKCEHENSSLSLSLSLSLFLPFYFFFYLSSTIDLNDDAILSLHYYQTWSCSN